MRVSTRSAVLGVAVGFCMGLIPSILFGDSMNYIRVKPEHAQSERSAQAWASHKTNSEHIATYRTPSQKLPHALFGDESGLDAPQPRKIFLDCGANMASSVLLFRETYPGAKDFTIHSFEIDDRLSPFFAPYDKLNLHCPLGVAGKDGNMTAYSEMVWGPNKGLNHGTDMMWGGGTLFVNDEERNNTETGGKRKLSYRKTIPVVDLSRWIMETFSIDDYIIFKLDVEGAEYEILRKMIDHKAFAYIDKYYGEFHDRQPSGWEQEDKDKIRHDLREAGYRAIPWAGESRVYGDIENMNPIKVPALTPGEAGEIYSSCGAGSVATVVAIGMNLKRAHRVVESLAAHKPMVPTTLFVYGDFAQAFPDTVKSWAERFDIGIREDGHNPPGHLELMANAYVRMALISSILRLEEIGITASYYLPTVTRISPVMKSQAMKRGLRIIEPAVEFPARNGTDQLTFNNYYRHRDVNRVPKALRRIHQALVKNGGGILSLDTDLPDTYMNSVFLMDYLVESSGFKLVNLNECILMSR